MIEHLVQTISLAYSLTEDRLELRCRSGEQSHSLWMSHRLWKQLAPALVKWLVDSGVGTPQSGDFLRDSYAENTAESVNVPEQTMAHAHKTAEYNNSSEDECVNDQDSELTTRWVPEPWLATTVHLRMAEQRIRLELVSDRSEHMFVFTMSALEAGHFLIAQRQALKDSEWPFNWPTWLTAEHLEEPAAGVKFLH